VKEMSENDGKINGKIGEIVYDGTNVGFSEYADVRTYPTSTPIVGVRAVFGFTINDEEARKLDCEKYDWIQVIDTNKPILPTAVSPYVDPYPDDDGKPFYFPDHELPRFENRDGYKLKFTDRPSRHKEPDIKWEAELCLVCAKDKKLKILKCIKYGFTTNDKGKVCKSGPVSTGTGSQQFRDTVKKEFGDYDLE